MLGVPTVAFPSPSPPALITRDSVVRWAALEHLCHGGGKRSRAYAVDAHLHPPWCHTPAGREEYIRHMHWRPFCWSMRLPSQVSSTKLYNLPFESALLICTFFCLFMGLSYVLLLWPAYTTWNLLDAGVAGWISWFFYYPFIFRYIIIMVRCFSSNSNYHIFVMYVFIIYIFCISLFRFLMQPVCCGVFS